MHPLELKLLMLSERVRETDVDLADELKTLASASHYHTPTEESEDWIYADIERVLDDAAKGSL